LETARKTIAPADRSSVVRLDASSIRPVDIDLRSDDIADRGLKSGDTTYSAAVLAELSALVRRVRVVSPDSILAGIADAKIGRSIGLGGGDSTGRPGAPRSTP
jgi:hypothetical protein